MFIEKSCKTEKNVNNKKLPRVPMSFRSGFLARMPSHVGDTRLPPTGALPVRQALQGGWGPPACLPSGPGCPGISPTGIAVACCMGMTGEMALLTIIPFLGRITFEINSKTGSVNPMQYNDGIFRDSEDT